MGKVKLARNLDTGEQAAIKIVPRFSQEDHRSQQDRDRADHSKEVRTQREAAIVTLVNHPYICGMRDVLRTNYHWYMLFEYVNGGQMLDYIISHGRLKEKQARKFGRQIASALDYCHRNSIVHRDLKIENILISKTGDIKIIDFGLSNLFSPRSQLQTFCGSLYFAAPELLQAKKYTGPEVDVWSFGIVLYVLVCGKVPFDDQSMPQLHAKIKKGAVEYPPWLSSGKSLDPQWIANAILTDTTECKHIISRMLVTDPRNRATLAEIMVHPWITKGFNSAPDNCLPHRELLQLPLDHKVIEKMTGFDFGSAEYIQTQLESIIDSDDYQKAVRNSSRRPQQPQPIEGDRKRGSVFDFYQRRKPNNSRDAINNPSSEAVHVGEDTLNAFSPLISIYYLVREKQEREKQEKNPGALSIPGGDDPLKLPDLPPPKAAVTNSSAFEMKGEAPTGGRSRPRARTQGEDEISDTVRKTSRPAEAPNPIVNEPPSRSPAPKKEGTAAGLLRKFSTRRTRDNDVDREKPKSQPAPSSSPAPVMEGLEEPSGPARQSLNIRKARERDTPPSAYRDVAQKHPDLLAPPTSGNETPPTRKSKTLGRSTSVNSADLRRRWSLRRGVSEGGPSKIPQGTESEKSSLTDKRGKDSEKLSDSPGTPSSARMSFTQRTKSVGGRRESIQSRRHMRDDRSRQRQDDLPEETDQELADEYTGGVNAGESQEALKPVYLKGLFSVSTTSSKPLSVIRTDIIRVLNQLGVNFREMKTGFSCRHVPSIDLNRVKDPDSRDPSGAASGDPKSSMHVHRRKISFAGLRNNEKDRDDTADQQQRTQSTPKSAYKRHAGADSSYENSGEESEDENAGRRSRRTPRAAGETTTHVQSDLGQSMILRFEILVVKVPIVSLHGLQFKKVDGGTWQYKRMAETILSELRL